MNNVKIVLIKSRTFSTFIGTVINITAPLSMSSEHFRTNIKEPKKIKSLPTSGKENSVGFTLYI